MKLQTSFFLISLFSLTMCNFAQTVKEQNHVTDKDTKDTSKNRIVLIKTIDKGDYFYIPPSAFSDTVDAVLYQDKTRLKVIPVNRPIKLSWTSTCNDGDYILTITPEQIFFSSGHENPNPNFLFWMMDITRKQFEMISSGLRRQTPKGFIDLTAPRTDSLFQDESEFHLFEKKFREPCSMPKNWNDITQHTFSTCCDTTISRQLTFYFKILNNFISADDEQISLPNIKKSLTKFPKYFSYFEEEIHDWSGMRPKSE